MAKCFLCDSGVLRNQRRADSSKAPIVFALGLAITRDSPDTPIGIVLALNTVAIGTFAALGFFAARGAKAAFIIGLVLYGGDTGHLLLSANPGLHIISIVIHGVFLFSIFKGIPPGQIRGR